MRDGGVREGELCHLGDVSHEVLCAMRENSGEDCKQGEENSRPVGDLDKKEMVDMNPALGRKDKVN